MSTHHPTANAHTPAPHQHTHAQAHGHPQDSSTESIPALKVAGYGLLLYMAVVAVVIVVVIYFVTYANTFQISSEEFPERFGGSSAAIQQNALAARAKAFSSFTSAQSEWVDIETGAVRLPMSSAMQTVIERYNKR
ncbi:MAG: hypothetical protein LW822_05505 [Phycisphaeraceae bacterium]|jgi:hypothetical protein|nr:hypothetical protein [Phycisphaeraceae bacterium]